MSFSNNLRLILYGDDHVTIRHQSVTANRHIITDTANRHIGLITDMPTKHYAKSIRHTKRHIITDMPTKHNMKSICHNK